MYFAAMNYTDFNFSVIREMLEHGSTLPGLNDDGAHVSVISSGAR